MNIFGEYGDLALLILLVAVIVLLILLLRMKSQLRRAERRIDDLTAGSDGESLEEMLINIIDSYGGMNRQLEHNTEDIRDLYRRMHYAVQKVGVVKYDAFKQMGGNLSSVIALLDQDNNGILLNTVQNIDGCYSYLKEVHGGRSDVDLTDEEQDAMEMAMGSHSIRS